MVEVWFNFSKTENPRVNIEVQDLMVSQSTPWDVIYANDSEMAMYEELDFPSFKSFLAFLSHNSLEQNLALFDATNSCVFLCLDICQRIMLSKDEVEIGHVVNITRDIIMTGPLEYNKVRDINRTYALDEVLKIIPRKIYSNGSFSFIAQTSVDLRKKIKSCIQSVSKMEKRVAFVYLCDIYAFSIAVHERKIFLIETHKVSPENGMVCMISREEEDFDAVLNELTCLIEKRLLLSLQEKIYNQRHEINVLSQVSPDLFFVQSPFLHSHTESDEPAIAKTSSPIPVIDEIPLKSKPDSTGYDSKRQSQDEQSSNIQDN